MFFKSSRYRPLPDIDTLDTQQRHSTSKSFRPLPEALGNFLHTVQDGERLDHLAYKYYKQPTKWWRICDANPEFLCPQTLVGKMPVLTTRFTLNNQSDTQRLAELLQQLRQQPGVENVRLVEELRLVTEQQTHQDQTILVNVEQMEHAVLVTYNQLNISTAELARLIETTGFGVQRQESIGRVGKKIIIPPDALG